MRKVPLAHAACSADDEESREEVAARRMWLWTNFGLLLPKGGLHSHLCCFGGVPDSKYKRVGPQKPYSKFEGPLD